MKQPEEIVNRSNSSNDVKIDETIILSDDEEEKSCLKMNNLWNEEETLNLGSLRNYNF